MTQNTAFLTQTKTISDVFDDLEWNYTTEVYEEQETIEFSLALDEDEDFRGLKAVHEPGYLTLFSVANVEVPADRIEAVQSFISLFNNAVSCCCLLIRGPAPAEVSIRTYVNYSHVENLESGYVAGAISTLTDMAEMGIVEAVRKVVDGQQAEAAWGTLLASDVEVIEPSQ